MSRTRTIARSFVLVTFFVSVLSVTGATSLGTADAAGACHDPTPAKHLPPDDAVDRAPLGPEAVRAMAETKAAAPDPEKANRLSERETALIAGAHLTKKAEMFSSGRTPVGSASVLADRATLLRECASARSLTRAPSILGRLGRGPTALAAVEPGYAWVDYLNHQGQINSYYCGPATVSEIAHTMYNNGRLASPVSQSDAGSYMGTNWNGTSVSAMVEGLNNFVGRPIAGWNYYAFVWIPFYPTQWDMNRFISHLDYDVRRGWPVAGDAWEYPYQPHLRGHPSHLEILHWFEIGGYGAYGNSTYYIDSATTVWASVQPYNWFDTWTLVVILGGRGYAW
jgi:hypothetical protein